MDRARTALERAFDLAKSGGCISVEDIKRCLRLEGYGDSQVTGTALRKQLQGLIAEARREPMAKRPKGETRPADVIGDAVKGMRKATGAGVGVAEDGKDKAAQSLGRRGGKARAEKMSAERRAEIAKKAAAQRWAKKSD
jgi:hypothetical protein